MILLVKFIFLLKGDFLNIKIEVLEAVKYSGRCKIYNTLWGKHRALY